MTHSPTLLDVAADLRRCIYASFDNDEFNSKNFLIFWENAQKILASLQNQLDNSTKTSIKKLLSKAQNSEFTSERRREDILTAAILLQNSAKL